MAIAEPDLELLQNACRAMACRGLPATVLQRLFEGAKPQLPAVGSAGAASERPATVGHQIRYLFR